MIKHMFVFGVVIPTIITIVFFVGFLICWFKFNIHKRLFTKRKPGKKNAFSAHEINSTQEIVQYGQGEEEYDNEKNSEFDKSKDDDNDHDKDLGDMSVSCTSDNGSSSNTKSKYVITPSEIEYHYQQNLKLSQGNEVNESHCSSDGHTECSACPACPAEGGVENNALIVSPSMELQPHDCKPSGELLVQHTFHFPNLAHCEANPKACQMEECQYYGESDDESDNDNENYGHFIPVPEVILQNEKRKQFYKSFGCEDVEGNGENDVSNLTAHLTPIHEG